jgi:hypothetical protein
MSDQQQLDEAAPAAPVAAEAAAPSGGRGGSGGIRMYIGNLPRQGQLATEASINEIFSKFGRLVEPVWVAKNPAGFAYVVSVATPAPA